ncbi:hypothetical protein SAMN06295888_1541 [Desulfonatronum zhilinae]|nr:hypothetical protein SAMN06295888_1541 [Desulfonatronum zhilinae]
MTTEQPNKDQQDNANIGTLIGNLLGIGIALLLDLLSKSRR